MKRVQLGLISFAFLVILAVAVSAEACYTSVKDIPATCEGGTISSDTYSGGRTITCGDLKVAAWDKDGYFEMYKQAGGSAVKLCIGSTCIKDNGYAKSPNYPICVGGTTNSTNSTNPSDPGAQSTLVLSSGAVNGQAVSPSSRIVTVAPGAAITGSVTLAYNNAWPTSISTPLGVTRSWGDAASGFAEHGDASGSGKSIALSYIAPSAPGDYNLIFAYRAETTTAHVFSLTNWAHGAPSWNDGNDIAQWSQSMINTANAQGRVQANVLHDDGMRQLYVPATGITIRVVSTTNSTNSTNQTNSTQACYTKVNDIPASCEGGTITVDEKGGCRKIICSGGGSSMQVLACNKPDGSPQYFEMYKQTTVGSGIKKVCIGNTCISTGGYAKSPNYPICVGSAVPNTTNTTNTTNGTNTTGGANVYLVEDAPGPYGWGKVSVEHNAVFNCSVPGFEPAEYRWTFGDGTSAVKNASNAPSWNTHDSGYRPYFYHTYLQNGTYTVTCTATNGTMSASGSTTVTIKTPAMSAEIAATNPRTDSQYYNPYVFRPVVQRMNGSTFRVGGYSIGLPRDGNNGGQYGYFAYNIPGFYSTITSTHDSILELVFPEPGNYSFYANAGGFGPHNAPETFNGGYQRGCSNPRTVCLASHGYVDLIVPDLGTRTQYGILTRPGMNGETEISCQSYITDAGRGGHLVVDSNWSDARPFTGNQWFSFNLAPGSHEVSCMQDAGALSKRYERVINVTGSTSPNSTNTTNTTSSACFSSVKNLNASCKNSNLASSREVGGCMEYVCSSNTGSITVKACDKPSTSYHPYYFEMYKTAKSGYGPNFCLGETCFQNSDFARSKVYPACLLAPDDRGWAEYLGGWSYSNGVYRSTNTNANVPVESYYTEGKQNGWTNYDVQVDVKLGSGYTPSDSHLLLRYQNESHYASCRIMQWDGTHLQIVDQYRSWAGTAPGGVIASTPYEFNVGQWYTIKASVIGNQITCEVAGAPETRITSTWSGPASGTVGLRGTHIPVDYRNMVVTFK